DATVLAEYLVGKGLPFRKAHEVVGRVVRQASEQGKPLAKLPLAQLQAANDLIANDVYDYLGASNVVARYRSVGAAGGKPLIQQLEVWKERLQ
ncbi:MAG: argininosuccinate lyase, partial [Phycisphaerae bacterium]|nr:argininosuccinate lyase [Phycisphaerae bacterium]